jgi:hypothetical protein
MDPCSFGPDALHLLNQAFDSAWREIADNIGNDPLEVQSARNKLADALLSAANDRALVWSVEALKTAGLRLMAISYEKVRQV